MSVIVTKFPKLFPKHFSIHKITCPATSGWGISRQGFFFGEYQYLDDAIAASHSRERAEGWACLDCIKVYDCVLYPITCEEKEVF